MKAVARKCKLFESPSPAISFRIQYWAKRFLFCLYKLGKRSLVADSWITTGSWGHTPLCGGRRESFGAIFKTNYQAYVSEGISKSLAWVGWETLREGDTKSKIRDSHWKKHRRNSSRDQRAEEKIVFRQNIEVSFKRVFSFVLAKPHGYHMGWIQPWMLIISFPLFLLTFSSQLGVLSPFCLFVKAQKEPRTLL